MVQVKKTLLTEMKDIEKVADLIGEKGDKKLKIGKNLIKVLDSKGNLKRYKVVNYSGDHSQVQKDMQDETDIKNILEKYGRTGILPVVANPGMYDDFSDVPDYQEAQNQIRKADEAFAALPSKIREKFENDPAKMIQYLNDESNIEESIKLGLRERKIVQEEIIQKVEVINQADNQAQ